MVWTPLYAFKYYTYFYYVTDVLEREGCGKKMFTEVIDGIHVGVTVNELLHHAFHCQPGGQDQGRGPVDL